MDKLTDMLSSFFVSSSKKNEQKKNNQDEKQSEKQSEKEERNDENEVTEKQSEKEERNDEKVTEKQSEKEERNDENEVTEKQSEKEERNDKNEITEKQSENKSQLKKDKLDKEKVVFTITTSDKLSESENTNEKSLFSSLSSKSLTKNKNSVTSESNSESNSESTSESTSKNIISKKNIKKYILRPSNFYKSNILIVNDDIKDSIDILSDLFYKLGLMKDVNNIYDNNIHVITSLENKKVFTKMLLDNPYLFFTNFDVKKQLSREKIKNLDNLEKRTIYIIDNKTLTKPLKHKDLQSLVSKNVHVIIIAGEEYNLDRTFNVMGNNKLLIHKLNKSKNMQKHFYKTTIKNLCLPNKLAFDDYYNIINNEDIDIKYIILKNDQIRYN